MTLGFHKHGGPLGIAALLIKNGAPFKPFIRGGGQEFGRRAGTENVVAIAGVSALLDSWSLDELADVEGWMGELQRQLPEDVIIASREVSRLGTTACIMMPGVSQEVQLMRMDLAGICIGAGSACTSGKIEPSHVLSAMGVPDELASTAIRVSAGWNTQKSDCEAFVKEYLALFTQKAVRDKIAS